MAASVTTVTTSTDIRDALDNLAISATSGAYSTAAVTYRPHWLDGDLGMLYPEFNAGAYHMGDSTPPVNVRSQSELPIRAWSFREIEAWINGCALSSPTFTYEAGTPSGRKCTIEIGAGSWEGTDAAGSDDEAAGLAFVELLNDPDYTDYCTLD